MKTIDKINKQLQGVKSDLGNYLLDNYLEKTVSAEERDVLADSIMHITAAIDNIKSLRLKL